MESSEKILPNSSSDNNKDVQSTLLHENVQKCTSKKKYYNTVFATKMRNRRKEEKLKKLNSEEILLTTCKTISVDVTRIASNVPKLISAIEHKNRKRKKFQWKLGITKKKKKVRDKLEKVQPIKSEFDAEVVNVNEKYTKNSNIKSDTCTEVIKDKKNDTDVIKSLEDKTDMQRRKSTRQIVPMTVIDKKCNFDTKLDVESILDESDSCRRIEPFIGKLNTKEARIQNIEKMLKEGSELINQNNNELIDDTKNNLQEEKEKNDSLNIDQQVSKMNKNIIDDKNVKNIANHEIEKKEVTNEEKQKNQDKTKYKASTSKNIENQLIDEELYNSLEKVIETKGIKDEETNCSRTVPFKGRFPWKPLSNTPKKSIKTGCSTSFENSLSTDIKLASCSKNTNNELSSKNMDSDSSVSDVKSELVPSTKPINKKLDVHVKDTTVILDTSSKDESTLIMDNSLKCVKTDLLIEEKESLNCLNDNAYLCSAKATISNTKEIWSCSRTEPYTGKEYSNCSRTLPFVRPTNKLKASGALETSRDSLNDISKLIETNKNNSHSQVNQLDDKNLDKSLDIPMNQENKLIDLPELPPVDSISITDTSNSETSSLVQNEEWKFRRKRQKTHSDDEMQVDEHVTKKLKIKSSVESKLSTEKKTAVVTSISPERTICSLFSLNCTKHSHRHPCNESLSSIKQDVSVLLTKLEDMKDSFVVDYFEKKGFNSTLTLDSFLLMKDKVHNEQNSNLNKENKHSPYLNEKKSVIKNDPSTFDQSANSFKTNVSDIHKTFDNEDEINKLSENKCSNGEFSIQPKLKLRRKSSRTSSESSNIVQTRRKKRPVNYLENFSDSDSSESSMSLSTRKTRSQSGNSSLRDRSKRRSCSFQDENDVEVEEFSHLGQKHRNKNEEVNNLNHDDTDRETSSSRKRSKSQGTGTVDMCEDKVHHQKCNDIEDALKNQTKTKVSSDLSNQQNDKSSLSPNDVIIDEEVDEQLHDNMQSKLHNRVPNAKTLKNSNIDQQETELNNSNNDNEQLCISDSQTPGVKLQTLSGDFSTPKIIMKNDSVNSVSKKSPNRASKTDELLSTPKKTLSTQYDEKEDSVSIHSCNSNKSNFSSKSSKHNGTKNNLLTKFTTTGSNLEVLDKPNKKEVLEKNLKVELIKLETVCDSFKDYSASEIEILTEKYIDLLMNSNFSCNTWRNSIKYNRSSDKHIEQIDNSDCVSDVETQLEDTESVSVELINNESVDTASIDNVESVKNINTEKSNDIITNNKSDLKHFDQNHLTSTLLETAIAKLADAETIEERNFGAVNISEALSTPSTNEKNKGQSALLNQEEVVYENELQVETIRENVANNPETISVNGHSSSTTTKSNEKQTAEVSGSSLSTKKNSSAKSKKKNKYLDSLQCSICSVTFDTKELLFDHIMTHNEQELQEAYKIAKAKFKAKQFEQSDAINSLSNESDKEDTHTSEEGEKIRKKKKKDKRKSIDSNIQSNRTSIDNEDINADNSINATITRTSVIVPSSQSQKVINLSDNESYATIEPIPFGATITSPLIICPCHAYETINQDLQIEMVLLCKTCNVIFRRRECFEVHYRNNPECRRKRTNNEMTKVPKLFCSGCPCVINSLMEMRTHLEMHAKKNSQGTVTFICNICKVAFFGVGGIFYSHWFNHTKAPNFVASRYSFPKLSVVSVLEDSNVAMTTSKSQEGFFYIAEHVCRQCRLPFSSEPELQKHKLQPCQTQQSSAPRTDALENNRLQMIKLICDLCKKYYVSKENFDRHCSERNHLKTPIIKFSRLPLNANEQAFVCSLCRAVSKSLDDMKDHWKRIHSPILELYTCKTCNVMPSNDVSNYTYEKFERHCRMVHKSEVITCLVCFVTARYTCNICRFGFETEKSMKDHQIVHQKRSSSQGSSTNYASLATTISGLPIEPQTTTLWFADNNVNPDGGRQVHPVYVHYPGANGNANTQVPLSSNTVIGPQNEQDQPVYNQGQVNVISNTTGNHGQANVNVTQTSNFMLRTMLGQKTLDQQQSQQNSKNVETIFIDSRSNSPVISNTAASINNKSTTNNEHTVIASKKSYMTMVNPDFESILGANNFQTNDKDNDVLPLNKEDLNSTDKTLTDSSTVVPFEVVLVTDDLSENSNSQMPVTKEKNTVPNKTVHNDEILNQQQQKQQAMEHSSTKSFLRVRSIAELQRMRIHLCSICGQSFDTPQAFKEHSKQHESFPQVPNEIERATPVQMISPMITQNNTEMMRDSPSMNMHTKDKMSLLTSNRQMSLNNTDINTGINRSLLSHQPQNQEEQQNYWFASCNGTNTTSSPNLNSQHQTGFLRNVITSNIASLSSAGSSLGPPPSYFSRASNLTTPGRSSTIQLPESSTSRGPPLYFSSVASNLSTPGRSSAIQLPERNITNGKPTTKRPSGAATRIPQQSLPNFEELSENRQFVSPHWNFVTQGGYQVVSQNISQGGSTINSRLHPNAITRQPEHSYFQGKTYGRHSDGTGGLTYTSTVNSGTNSQQLQQIPKAIYSCKISNCTYRSDNLLSVRLHEKSHLNSQQHSPTSTNQISQVQQQRLPVKHVSVSQMPERSRNTISNSRQVVSTNLEKRYTCRICNLECASNNELVEHVATVHGNLSTQLCCYVCDYCPTPLLFESELLLRQHMDTSHNYFCILCNKRYPSKCDLMIHMDIHGRST